MKARLSQGKIKIRDEKKNGHVGRGQNTGLEIEKLKFDTKK